MSAKTGGKLPSNTKYLFNAIYEWLVDNDQTPYIIVNLNYPGVRCPPQFKQDSLTLNVSMTAAKHLHVGQDALTFGAGFQGKHYDLYIPLGALISIFGRESGEGMQLNLPDADKQRRVSPPLSPSATAEQEQAIKDYSPASTDNSNSTPPPRPSGKPTLRVVK